MVRRCCRRLVQSRQTQICAETALHSWLQTDLIIQWVVELVGFAFLITALVLKLTKVCLLSLLTTQRSSWVEARYPAHCMQHMCEIGAGRARSLNSQTMAALNTAGMPVGLTAAVHGTASLLHRSEQQGFSEAGLPDGRLTLADDSQHVSSGAAAGVVLFRHRFLEITNIVTGGICITALAAMGTALIMRILRVTKHGKVWWVSFCRVCSVLCCEWQHGASSWGAAAHCSCRRISGVCVTFCCAVSLGFDMCASGFALRVHDSCHVRVLGFMV